jgi:hypothetical protein
VHVPKHVNADGIHPHRPDHLKPVLPVFLWNTRRMDLTREKLDRLIIQKKLPFGNAKGVSGFFLASTQKAAKKDRYNKKISEKYPHINFIGQMV